MEEEASSAIYQTTKVTEIKSPPRAATAARTEFQRKQHEDSIRTIENVDGGGQTDEKESGLECTT
jgi:hypothetical protein